MMPSAPPRPPTRRERSRLGALILILVAAFVVLAVAVVALGLYARHRQQANDKLSRELVGDLRELRGMEANALLPMAALHPERVPASDEAVDALADAIHKRAEGLPKAGRVRIVCAAEAIRGRVHGGRTFREAVVAAQPAYVLKSKGSDQRAVLAQREAALSTLETIARQFLAAREQSADKTRACIRAEGGSEEGLDQSSKNAYHVAALELLHVYVDYATAARAHVALVSSMLGRIHYDAASDTLTADRRTDLKQLNDSVQRVNAVADRIGPAELTLLAMAEADATAQDAGAPSTRH